MLNTKPVEGIDYEPEPEGIHTRPHEATDKERVFAAIYEWNRLNLWGSIGRIFHNLNTREFAEEDTAGYLVPLSSDGRREVTKCVAKGLLA